LARILIIDDEKDCLLLMKIMLGHAGHEVFPLMRADRFLAEIREVAPDLIITDIMMPGVTGGSIYSAIREEISEKLPIIISSGTKMKLRLPVDRLLEYCPKPISEVALLDTVDRLLWMAQNSDGHGEVAPAGDDMASELD
jgi:DNA-binding NtrC family response regulator